MAKILVVRNDEIDAHIKNLRAKLEVDPKQPFYIQTVFGVGYRFPSFGV